MEECVVRLDLAGRQLIVIGTIHLSRRSVEQVRTIIDMERPDTVCVELDALRYLALAEAEGDPGLRTDIVCRSPFILLNTLIAALQKRLARDFGLLPGEDLIQAVNSAKTSGARLVLADCNIQAAFRRIWSGLSAMEKAKLLIRLFGLMAAKTKLSEADLEHMKTPDTLAAALERFGAEFPELKRMLIDERDQILAQNIKTAPGRKVVAVVGAAHVPGIVRRITGAPNPESGES